MPHPHDNMPKRPPPPMADVRGTPYEMGFQQGEQCREAIRRLVPAWVDGYVKDRVDDARKVTEHQFPSNLKIYPNLLEELRGVADGSGVDYEKVVQMNFRVWNHIGSADPAPSCTVIGMLTENEGVAVGANLDDPRECYGLIRRAPKNALTHVTNTWIGAIWGTNGINEAGLAIGQASLAHPAMLTHPELRAACREYYFGTIIRIILQSCRDAPEALAVLRRYPTFSSCILGDAKGNLVLAQCWGATRGIRQANDHGNMVFTTNHHFLPEVVDALARHGLKPHLSDYSRVRFEVLERAHKTAPRAVEVLKRLLRSHEGSDEDGLTCMCNINTAMSTYALPQARPNVLFVADQPPCRNDYVEYAVRSPEA
jgi:predicted choloylglycine hydrolase